MVGRVFSRLGYIYTLTLLTLLLLPGWSQASPILVPRDHRPGPGVRGGLENSLLDSHPGPGVIAGLDTTLLEQADLDIEDILGQFLSTLNLTERQPQRRLVQKEPSEYMLELYRRFANDLTAVPSTNIVRSFKNEDSSPHSVTSEGVRSYPLLFHISIPPHEHISTALLRLHTLVQRDRRQFAGLDRKVTVYKVRDGGHWRAEKRPGRGRGRQGETREIEALASQHVHAEDDGWVSFDLTHALRQWREADGATHRLEVHIASVGSENKEVPPKVTREDRPVEDVDMDSSSDRKHEPVLIVFSDDQSIREDKWERSQPLGHENDLPAAPDKNITPQPIRLNDAQNGGLPDNQEQDKQSLMQLHSNLIYDTPPRLRRNVKGESCRRTPLYVEFKDIGWDTWVIQPLGYEAYECNGVCSPPMTSEVSPTKHAIVQTLLSVHRPQMASRACCVPTKLEAIPLLYEEGGVVTYKHKYEGMVVAECGCR